MLVTAAVAGLCMWKFSPLIPQFTEFDRSVFECAVKGFSNPPFFISGNGSHARPWSLRVLSTEPADPGAGTLSVISVGDDPEGFFQSSPPQAVDYAVMLRNLKRLGVRKVALADQMAWDEADPIALTALDSRLADFESAVTCASLTRGAVAEPLPLPFHLASIPLSGVKGDVSILPQVNRVALPGTFLGSGRTLAGFSLLESEPGAAPLLARWKDRVVFAFPVIAALAETGSKPEEIEVRLGSYLKLGPGGPVVPIDASGRPAVRPARFPSRAIPATELIAAETLASEGTVLLRNDRSVADPAVKEFSEGVANTIASISRETGLSRPRVFPRLSDPAESALLLALPTLLFLCAAGSHFRIRLAFSAVLVLILSAQLAGLAWFSVWLPLYPELVATFAGFLAAWPLKAVSFASKPFINEAAVPEPLPEPVAPVQETPANAVEALSEPPVKVAKKAARKTVKRALPADAGAEPVQPAIKVAKKAAPAKKAAKKAATNAKTPARKAAKKAARKSPKPPEPG